MRNSTGRKTLAEYHEYLRGKRVVLVCPAGYLADEGKGPEIDGHDVVIRANSYESQEVHPSYGTRTDVLYATLGKCMERAAEKLEMLTVKDLEGYKACGVQWLLVRKRDDYKRVRRLGAVIDSMFSTVIDEGQVHLEAEMVGRCGRTPSAGAFALAHLLQAPYGSLTILGMDFYRSSYHNETVTDEIWVKMHKSHDIEAQLDYTRSILAGARNVRIDWALRDALEYGTQRGVPR